MKSTAVKNLTLVIILTLFALSVFACKDAKQEQSNLPLPEAVEEPPPPPQPAPAQVVSPDGSTSQIVTESETLPEVKELPPPPPEPETHEETLAPPPTSVTFESKVKRVWLSIPNIKANSDFEPSFLKNPEIANDIKIAGFSAVLLPIHGASHPSWIGHPEMLGSKTNADIYYNNVSFYDKYEPSNEYFARDCGGDKCSVAKILEGNGIGVIPYIAFFYNENENKKLFCNEQKNSAAGTKCPAADCPSECVDGFSWWNDSYWNGVNATIKAGAKYVCSGELPQKALLFDLERYFGYDDTQNGWLYLPPGRTESERIQKAYLRGRSVAKSAGEGCHGVDIFQYAAFSGSSQSDDTITAWLAGLSTENTVNSVYFLSSIYYQDSTHTRTYDYLRDIYDSTWGSIDKVSKKYNISMPFTSAHAKVTAWPTVYNEQFYAGLCILPVTVCTSAPDGTSKCGLTNASDYFNYKREKLYESSASLQWFDIPPEYAEKELDILRSTVDTLVIYPGSSQYLCYPGSTFCKNGLFDTIWKPNLIWNENMGLVKNKYFNAGDSTCLAPVTNYFNNETLQKRSGRIAAALQSVDEQKIVDMRKNDILPPAEGRFLAESKSWSEVVDKITWNIDELDINAIDANWQRRLGSAGEPPYVFEGTGSDTAHVLSVGTWGTKVVKDDDWQIEKDDADIEVLVSSDSKINFDGVITPFAANASNEDSVFKNWHWIKLARRYISASNNEFGFYTPASGQKTLIGGIRFKRNGADSPKADLWIGNAMQEWLHGHGWARDTVSGGLKFDPAAAFAMDNDINLPFTTEIIALPGRPIDQAYQACVLIEPGDQSKPAKVTYQVPGKGATTADHELETAQQIWAPIHANFIALENYRQWQIKFIPKPDSGPFVIKKVRFYESTKALNQNGGYDPIKAAPICGSYKF